jgi:hypothetical protein
MEVQAVRSPGIVPAVYRLKAAMSRRTTAASGLRGERWPSSRAVGIKPACVPPRILERTRRSPRPRSAGARLP